MNNAAYYAGFNRRADTVQRQVYGQSAPINKTVTSHAELPVWGWSADQWNWDTHNRVWAGSMWGYALYTDDSQAT